MSFFDKFKIKKKTDVVSQTSAPKKEDNVSSGGKKAEEPAKKKTGVRKALGESYGVLVKPLITEKATFLGRYSQYVFEITPRANKVQVAKAVEKAYGVKPVKVNIIKTKGKDVRYGKNSGRTKERRKAIVILSEGEKIEIYEGV